MLLVRRFIDVPGGGDGEELEVSAAGEHQDVHVAVVVQVRYHWAGPAVRCQQHTSEQLCRIHLSTVLTTGLAQ